MIYATMLKDKANREHATHTHSHIHTHMYTYTKLPNDVCERVKEVGNYAAYKSNKPNRNRTHTLWASGESDLATGHLRYHKRMSENRDGETARRRQQEEGERSNQLQPAAPLLSCPSWACCKSKLAKFTANTYKLT